ncbi:hypothetical protein CEXT_714331 [Caerostris extrusa]|uniref:Uncharacterized protein n=1 Tax=Caerostris extrusa TaxID=172846 RepID=A0AAV4VTQ6_CAEEX|nr:hypothetical protein CEXT_714331 [Caerostris extrusa]
MSEKIAGWTTTGKDIAYDGVLVEKSFKTPMKTPHRSLYGAGAPEEEEEADHSGKEHASAEFDHSGTFRASINSMVRLLSNHGGSSVFGEKQKNDLTHLKQIRSIMLFSNPISFDLEAISQLEQQICKVSDSTIFKVCHVLDNL